VSVPAGAPVAPAPASKAAPSKPAAAKPSAAAGKPAAAKPSAVARPSPSKAAPAPSPKAAPAKAAPPKAAPARAKARADDDAEDVDGAEGASWEDSEMLQYDEWTFRELGWLRINVKNRHFHICKAATKDPIGYADEKCSGLFLALRALGSLAKWLPTTVEIREQEDGPLLLAICKINVPLLPWTDIVIFDGQWQKLGYFRTKIFSILGGFWLYDADGEEVAEVKAKLGMPPRYLFLSKDGRELGSVGNEAVTKATESKKITLQIGRPSLRLKMAEEMAEEHKVKVLMMATALAFEFTGVGDKLLK
jgi:hypothetical protein